MVRDDERDVTAVPSPLIPSDPTYEGVAAERASRNLGLRGFACWMKLVDFPGRSGLLSFLLHAVGLWAMNGKCRREREVEIGSPSSLLPSEKMRTFKTSEVTMPRGAGVTPLMRSATAANFCSRSRVCAVSESRGSRLPVSG
jgi:hypothetical protein